MEKQPAVAIVTGYCTNSNLLLVLGIKYYESVTVLFHGQKWEQYCCFTNMIFDQKQMVAQLYQSAISFSTLPGSISAPPTFQSANISPLSVTMLRQITPLSNKHEELYISYIEVFLFLRYIFIHTDIISFSPHF
jgi:hypothetical protein